MASQQYEQQTCNIEELTNSDINLPSGSGCQQSNQPKLKLNSSLGNIDSSDIGIVKKRQRTRDCAEELDLKLQRIKNLIQQETDLHAIKLKMKR